MNKYSRNWKLNRVLTAIEEDLIALGIDEVKRYMNEFKNEIDYNIAQYGNLIIYYDDVRALYYTNGYTSTIKKMSNSQLWETYKRQVGYVARQLTR